MDTRCNIGQNISEVDSQIDKSCNFGAIMLRAMLQRVYPGIIDVMITGVMSQMRVFYVVSL